MRRVKQPSLFSIFIVIVLAFASATHADAQKKMVLVVNKNVKLEKISKSQVKDLYLRRLTTFPGMNKKVKPLDQKERVLREYFYLKTMNYSLRKVNSYWARYVFSGKGSPPVKVQGDAAIVERVTKDDSYIGYISESAMTADLKIVYRVD